MTRISEEDAHRPASRRIATVLTSLARGADNKRLYSARDAVAAYSSHDGLQPNELAILERLRPWLNGRRMLDIGVGAGRTTSYFAPLVTTYVGADYAPPMIAACKSRFGEELANVTFTVADVRDLSSFGNSSFDFVLFSANGIDCIGHEDRLTALAELRRVCSPSGFICFSSHNLGAISYLFRLRPNQKKNALSRVLGLLVQVIFRTLNSSERTLSQKDHAIVRESCHEFRASAYYIYPREQLKQLADAGFSYVELYGLDGRHIELSEAGDSGDLWVYYLAGNAADELVPSG